MTTIDFTPIYRSSIGFDRLASMLEGALHADKATNGYPPYDIEAIGDDCYTISLAVAGFTEDELDIQVERGVLTVKGKKSESDTNPNYLYRGIATRAFERKFNLADYIKITGARLQHGLLMINLEQEVPEAMKPRRIEINSDAQVLEHQSAPQADSIKAA